MALDKTEIILTRNNCIDKFWEVEYNLELYGFAKEDYVDGNKYLTEAFKKICEIRDTLNKSLSGKEGNEKERASEEYSEIITEVSGHMRNIMAELEFPPKLRELYMRYNREIEEENYEELTSIVNQIKDRINQSCSRIGLEAKLK